MEPLFFLVFLTLISDLLNDQPEAFYPARKLRLRYGSARNKVDLFVYVDREISFLTLPIVHHTKLAVLQ